MHFSVGDIVQRIDIKGRKKYLIVRIAEMAQDGSTRDPLAVVEVGSSRFHPSSCSRR